MVVRIAGHARPRRRCSEPAASRQRCESTRTASEIPGTQGDSPWVGVRVDADGPTALDSRRLPGTGRGSTIRAGTSGALMAHGRRTGCAPFRNVSQTALGEHFWNGLLRGGAGREGPSRRSKNVSRTQRGKQPRRRSCRVSSWLNTLELVRQASPRNRLERPIGACRPSAGRGAFQKASRARSGNRVLGPSSRSLERPESRRPAGLCTAVATRPARVASGRFSRPAVSRGRPAPGARRTRPGAHRRSPPASPGTSPHRG